jgi:hypothetical protein
MSFVMPDTSGSDSTDPTSTDSTSGDGALSSLFGLNGLGSGYGVVTYTQPPTSTSAGSDLSTLQSGSSGLSDAAIANMFDTTLGTVVAIDSINAQSQAVPTGYYKASNGQVYQVGTGPASVAVSNPAGSMLFWLMIGACLWWAIEEGKL